MLNPLTRKIWKRDGSDWNDWKNRLTGNTPSGENWNNHWVFIVLSIPKCSMVRSKTENTTRGCWWVQTKTKWFITYNTLSGFSQCFPAWGGLGFRLTNPKTWVQNCTWSTTYVHREAHVEPDTRRVDVCNYEHEAPVEGAQKKRKRRKEWPSPCWRRWSKKDQDGSMVLEEH